VEKCVDIVEEERRKGKVRKKKWGSKGLDQGIPRPKTANYFLAEEKKGPREKRGVCLQGKVEPQG